jgi:hypothetical protein
MKEALSASETSVLTRATRRYISEDTILHLVFLLTAFAFRVHFMTLSVAALFLNEVPETNASINIHFAYI